MTKSAQWVVGAALGVIAELVLVTQSRADTCEAIPDSGPMPSYLSFGASFSGPVVEVIDGDSLCVAVGPRPRLDWVEVRLADFYAPESSSPAGPAAKAALERITSGKDTTCVASLGTYDRIAATCRIEGRSIGDLMRTAGVLEGGNGRGASAPVRRGVQSPRPGRPGETCAQIRARGGVRRGNPGYRPEWDGDGDGIACEPYRRR